jgi:formylglycine-generating enzyme required for sulfatase activity
MGPFDLGSPFMLQNHPVVGITWYEALAYTCWLTERWRALGFIGADQGVALPSEPEWEKAARGGLEIVQLDSQPARPRPARSGLPTLNMSKDQLALNEQPQRRYPWGPYPDRNRANYVDTGIGMTSVVGIFHGGASPYGCEEMSGNCWEWTRSLSGDYPYPQRPGNRKKREALNPSRYQSRILRGGGFNNHLEDVRCAYRRGGGPSYHGGDIGFRVVVRPLL